MVGLGMCECEWCVCDVVCVVPFMSSVGSSGLRG